MTSASIQVLSLLCPPSSAQRLSSGLFPSSHWMAAWFQASCSKLAASPVRKGDHPSPRVSRESRNWSQKPPVDILLHHSQSWVTVPNLHQYCPSWAWTQPGLHLGLVSASLEACGLRKSMDSWTACEFCQEKGREEMHVGWAIDHVCKASQPYNKPAWVLRKSHFPGENLLLPK